MSDLKEPRRTTINGSIVVEQYESRGGPAIHLSEAQPYHEHNFVRMMVSDMDALLKWFNENYRSSTTQQVEKETK